MIPIIRTISNKMLQPPYLKLNPRKEIAIHELTIFILSMINYTTVKF